MRPFIQEIRCEFLSLSRLPRYLVSVLFLPIMFFVFFGLMQTARMGSVKPSAYMISTMGTFGVMAACMWGVAGALATERGLGWMDAKRASPMPVLAYFVAKIITAALFSLVIVSVLFALAGLFGGLHMTVWQWASLGAALLGGVLPFSAMAILLGSIASPNSAPAMINLVAMPTAFLSGLLMPLEMLPQGVQRIAPYLPAYHVSRMVMSVTGMDTGGRTAWHLTSLFAITLLLSGMAWYAWRKGEAKAYG